MDLRLELDSGIKTSAAQGEVATSHLRFVTHVARCSALCARGKRATESACLAHSRMRRTHLACEDAPLVRKLCCRDVGSSAAVCRHCHRTLHIAERVARARGMCLGRKTCRRLSRTRASRSRNLCQR
mmetsp:Transcript_30103/g.93115  ORF Transcript_30103/g.93115 Transcript_30103/m.93115 type:complete len:127 (+) Transcript_30103:253-633(+)